MRLLSSLSSSPRPQTLSSTDPSCPLRHHLLIKVPKHVVQLSNGVRSCQTLLEHFSSRVRHRSSPIQFVFHTLNLAFNIFHLIDNLCGLGNLSICFSHTLIVPFLFVIE
jgi:hypothetical protein